MKNSNQLVNPSKKDLWETIEPQNHVRGNTLEVFFFFFLKEKPSMICVLAKSSK